MARFLFYNDECLPEKQPLITAGNRGFRYGDGLFETFCVVEGGIRLVQYHFERLFAGMELLGLQLPAGYDAAYFCERITTLCEKNREYAARVRLTVFRGEGMLYEPFQPASYIIESAPIVPPSFQNVKTPDLRMGIFPHPCKSADVFSHLKSNNYLPSAVAAIYARKAGWGDAFLLNTDGRVCESAVANVFIARAGQLYTPPLSEGCVAGVARRLLLETLEVLGFPVHEKALTVQELYAADEVFVTNALHLLRPVSRIGNNAYPDYLFDRVYRKLEPYWVEFTQ